MGFFKKKNSNENDSVNKEENLEQSEAVVETAVTEGKGEELEANEAETSENSSSAVNGRDIADIVDEVVDYYTQVDPIRLNMLERGKIKKEDFEKEVRGYIHNNITKDKELGDRIFDGFASFVWKYDIIDELIEDDEISDIKIYDWDHIRVKREGHRENSSVKFRSEKAFSKFVEHTAIKNKVSISDQNAAQNFVDKTSSDKAILRFNVTTGFINSSGKYMLSIRKILKHKRTTEELIEQGLFNQEQADYLIRRISEGGGVLVAGKGGSGKTTLLNWMIDFIPEDCSGLVIQENEEMFSNHPDMMFQHTVTNRGEGKIEYNLGDLARNGLLADIDYFIIGEIKGAEALYLLNAVYTGAKGWASVHGASAQEAMKKLTDYIKYNSDYTQEEALQMLIHLDTVIFMENYNVKEIAEVVGYSEEKGNLEYKMIAADGKMLHDNDNKAVNSKAETKENKN